MNTVTPLYLHKMPLLAELFATLNSGRHLNRLADHRLWAELEKERSDYERLFDALGYQLRVDDRGFAWFHFDEASSTVSKTTRQLALLWMLIFSTQADAGQHLGRFTDWVIDRKLLATLIENHRAVLEAEGLSEVEYLEQLMKSASNYGFAQPESGHWRLLPAVFRYLDRFEELAGKQDTVSDDDQEAVPHDEEPQ